MLNYLKQEVNMTLTENGAVTYESTQSDCLDLFATIGAIRRQSDAEIMSRFMKAFAENRELAMKILFHGRDIRGGLGERRVFRVILQWLAENEASALRKNLALIPEYGRFDDLLCLLDTPCAVDALALIRKQLHADMASEDSVSLLAKWLPSVNASDPATVKTAKRIAGFLKMNAAEYRKTLSALRRKIDILENRLREKDYSFAYSEQPSKAMLKYRSAFFRNDYERYNAFLEDVALGKETMHTGTVLPYEVIKPCFRSPWGTPLSESERKALNTTWNALEDFTNGENALVVVDGSGSMYGGFGEPTPIQVAISLGIYYAERNKGSFANHFITFSMNPQMVEIKGRDIAEKVRYCMSYNECANTDVKKVFELILHTAVKNHVPRSQMPSKIYIISDMEFDWCAKNSSLTNFEYAQQRFEEYGYRLPDVVFWNVDSRHANQPVTMNEQGVALVSGCNPRIFSMVSGEIQTPYMLMMKVLGSERYAPISA